jgi:hypothetical protein
LKKATGRSIIYQFLRGKNSPFRESGVARIGRVHDRQKRVIARGENEYLFEEDVGTLFLA